MIRARWPALALLVGVCVGLTSQVPRLRLALEPEAIVPVDDAARARMRAALGPLAERPPVILLLVTDRREALSPDALSHLHAAARQLGRGPWVAQADSVTSTPLPMPARERAGLTLAEVERAPDPDPALREALGRVVSTDPERFPMGLASLRPPLEWRPAVDGARVTDAQRRRLRRALERAPELARRMTAEEGTTLVLALTPRPELDAEGVLDAARDVERWTAEHAPPAGVHQRLAGLPSVRLAMLDDLARDQGRLPLWALLGSALLLALAFRRPSGVLLPLGAAGLGCGAVVGAMAALGQPVDLLTNVVPPLLITIGLGDAVHLTLRYREERRRAAPVDAAWATFRAMRLACLSTSLTTAVGFATLAVGGSRVMLRFGLTAALGVMVAYLITIVLLPATLPETALEPDEGEGGLERAIAALAAMAARHPRPVLLLGAGLLVAALSVGAGVRTDASLLEQLGDDTPIARTSAWVEGALDGYRVMDVAIAGPRGRFRTAEGIAELEAIEAWAAERPAVLRVDGPPGLLRAHWRALAGDDEDALGTDARVSALAGLAARTMPERWSELVSEDGAHARLEVRVRDAGERSLAELADAIEARFEGAVVGGEAARAARGLTALMTQLCWGLGLAVLVTFLVLGLTLRSVRLGLISLLPNLLPLALALAWMRLREIPLHASTAIVFAIAIGLAVDGTIHVLSRYREERGRAADPIDAAMRGSGRAITIAAAALAVGFVALLFASFGPIRRFAELSLVALASSWASELILLPALLALFSRPKDR